MKNDKGKKQYFSEYTYKRDCFDYHNLRLVYSHGLETGRLFTCSNSYARLSAVVTSSQDDDPIRTTPNILIIIKTCTVAKLKTNAGFTTIDWMKRWNKTTAKNEMLVKLKLNVGAGQLCNDKWCSFARSPKFARFRDSPTLFIPLFLKLWQSYFVGIAFVLRILFFFFLIKGIINIVRLGYTH